MLRSSKVGQSTHWDTCLHQWAGQTSAKTSRAIQKQTICDSRSEIQTHCSSPNIVCSINHLSHSEIPPKRIFEVSNYKKVYMLPFACLDIFHICRTFWMCCRSSEFCCIPLRSVTFLSWWAVKLLTGNFGCVEFQVLALLRQVYFILALNPTACPLFLGHRPPSWGEPSSWGELSWSLK